MICLFGSFSSIGENGKCLSNRFVVYFDIIFLFDFGDTEDLLGGLPDKGRDSIGY